MCWTPLYESKHKYGKYDMNSPQTSGGKEASNIVFMRKS